MRRQAIDGPASVVADVVPVVAALARPSCGSIEQHGECEGYGAVCYSRYQCSAMMVVVTQGCLPPIHVVLITRLRTEARE